VRPLRKALETAPFFVLVGMSSGHRSGSAKALQSRGTGSSAVYAISGEGGGTTTTMMIPALTGFSIATKAKLSPGLSRRRSARSGVGTVAQANVLPSGPLRFELTASCWVRWRGHLRRSRTFDPRPPRCWRCWWRGAP